MIDWICRLIAIIQNNAIEHVQHGHEIYLNRDQDLVSSVEAVYSFVR